MISHFVVAGRTERRGRSQLGSATISMGRRSLLRLSTVGDYRGHERKFGHSFGCTTRSRICISGFQDMNELGEQQATGLYLFGVQSKWQDT